MEAIGIILAAAAVLGVILFIRSKTKKTGTGTGTGGRPGSNRPDKY